MFPILISSCAIFCLVFWLATLALTFLPFVFEFSNQAFLFFCSILSFVSCQVSFECGAYLPYLLYINPTNVSTIF